MANLGIIFPLFRQTVLTYYLHALTMWIVAILTFVGTIIQIIVPNHDLQGYGRVHEIIGICVLSVTLSICFLGTWLRFAQ